VHPVYSVRGIELDEVTLPEMLDLGTGGAYRTAAIGKWHLGHTDDVGGASAPNVHGYEHFAGPLDNLDNHHVYTKVVDGQSMMSTTYALTEQVDDALAWIGSTTGPWFCYLAFSSVHGPFHAPPAGLHSVDTTPTGNQAADDRKLFEAMLEALDTEIGRLLAGIGPALDDTTIVFVGDNGTPGAVSLAPFDTQHGKATMYEGGLAVPLIVVGPDVQTPGTECDALVHASDLYATVAELARVDLGKVLPADAKLDSVSLLPYLADPTRASLRRYLTAEFFFPNGEGLGAPYVLPDLGPSICQVDLGFGGPGTTELALCGAYMALGNVVTPEISGAPPNANGMLLYAAMFLPKPFGFGTVTTLPAYEMVPFTTDALGMATLPPVKQLAIDVSVYMQAIVIDPGPGGFAISNTLRVDFLPWNLKAARSARYKLIRSSNGGPTELYDLALDPFETFDLLTGGPLSPDQADAFVRLSAVLDSL
jgi:arylsulfatase A-like enzyme